MKRIAIVLYSLLPWGGVERVVIKQAGEFLRRGYRVDLVFLNEPQDLRNVVPSGVRVFNLHISRVRYGLRPLVRYFRVERPHAVHAAMWPVTSLVLLAHRIAGSTARIIVSDHNPLSIQYASYGWFHNLGMRGLISMTYPLADARIAVSGGVAEDLAKLAGISRNQFTIVHNPISIDVDSNSNSSEVEAAWRGWTGKRILSVGRFKSQKNHALLIRAFKRLLGHLDARLMLLGVGEMHDATAALIQREGLEGIVLLPGQTANPIPYYRSADLFVLSSDYEGFGNVIVEAMACGLPVVSTDCPGGPGEILEHGRYGRLVPVGDERALELAMAETLSELRDRDMLQARAAAFSPEIAASKYLALLFPDLSSRGSPSVA